MKLYKTELYKVSYYNGELLGGSRAIIIPIGEVVVQKKFKTAKDLLTGYSKINIVPKSALREIGKYFKGLEATHWNRSIVEKEGEHLIVIGDDLKPGNVAMIEDIEHYVESYDSSKWKTVYEGMKKMSHKEKRQVYQKAKEVMGTKKWVIK